MHSLLSHVIIALIIRQTRLTATEANGHLMGTRMGAERTASFLTRGLVIQLSDFLLAEIFRVFPILKGNARRSVHTPRVCLIITLLVRWMRVTLHSEQMTV